MTRKLLDFANDIGAFLCVLLGILASRYVPLLHGDGEIVITLPEWGRVAVSALVALVVVGSSEVRGDVAGKRKMWLRRMSNAVAQGFMWQRLIGG